MIVLSELSVSAYMYAYVCLHTTKHCTIATASSITVSDVGYNHKCPLCVASV